MRPLRFLLLLGLFIVLPIVLTCISLFAGKESSPQPWNVGYSTRSSRMRALFSFSTPSALFPPTAVIFLTDDNGTSFMARPAAFGPSLPDDGLTGQLWVGKGFGEQISFSEENIHFYGFELGCSDIPGWNEHHKMKPENGALDGKPFDGISDLKSTPRLPSAESTPAKRDVSSSEQDTDINPEIDGTDDYFHHPLSDSNPASSQQPGEPATNINQDKSKPPVHADIESLQESADIAGKVVMLSRGGCGFLEKVKWAQRRGGIGVIVGDNEPGVPLTVMYAKGDTSNVTIPAIFTSYYSAHLLSTLVPSDDEVETGNDGNPSQVKSEKLKSKGKPYTKEITRPQNAVPARLKKASKVQDDAKEKGWMKNVLTAVGLDDDDAASDGADSRRPPASGNIDWVLLEDWHEDQLKTVSTSISTSTQVQKAVRTLSTSTRNMKTQTTATKKTDNDDFIIGIQDWRDTDLIAPKSAATNTLHKQKGKAETTAVQASSSTSSLNPTATALKGGSITPGSGEYGHQKSEANTKVNQHRIDKSQSSQNHESKGNGLSFTEKLASYFHRASDDKPVHNQPDKPSPHEKRPKQDESDDSEHDPEQREGLWVTLIPTSPSSSPFFDTLLVLVVSPLVTLTFVYGLLLLRSRIRRRRWRAPKSVVERLPVRTYHTMSANSSTTTSSLTSPISSIQNSPSLRPISTHSRSRPRSQTTIGVLSSSPSTEKASRKASPRRKRYAGRQVECVVCLEEYVDGESQVMSLPCGHEFHVDCITPWLVTRRRTCPICKGDVVRSLTRTQGEAIDSLEDEQRSDDVQDRAAMTANSESSAAIPIPVSEESSVNNDIERGSTDETPLLGSANRVQQGRWRGFLSSSFGRLSGDTVWRSSVQDRSR